MPGPTSTQNDNTASIHLTPEAQTELNNRLIQAAYQAAYSTGIVVMQECLNSGAEIDSPGSGMKPALIAAANYLRAQNVAYLLSQGANPNATAEYGRTALIYAVNAVVDELQNEDTAITIIKSLHQHQVSINQPERDGDTPLHRATFRAESAKLVACLLECGADVNLADREGKTPLMLAARSGSVAIVKILLAQPGIDIHAVDTSGASAVEYAVKTGNKELVDMLLAAGACADKLWTNGYTRLMFEVKCAKKEGIVDLQEFSKEEINTQDSDGITALMYAVRAGNYVLVQQLIAAGADVNLKDRKGKTALFYTGGKIENNAIAELLIQHDADINIVTAKGPHRKGDDIEKSYGTDDGITILHQAVTNSNLELVKRLIRKNIDLATINTKSDGTWDSDGYTPLFQAIRNIIAGAGSKAAERLAINKEIAILLLQANADPGIYSAGQHIYHLIRPFTKEHKVFASMLWEYCLQGQLLDFYIEKFDGWMKTKCYQPKDAYKHVYSFLRSENIDPETVKHLSSFIKRLENAPYNYQMRLPNIYPAALKTYGLLPAKATAPRLEAALDKIKDVEKRTLTACQILMWAKSSNRNINLKNIEQEAEGAEDYCITGIRLS
jgi:ankyrin repeat protein